jgi:hypothetical protein
MQFHGRAFRNDYSSPRSQALDFDTVRRTCRVGKCVGVGMFGSGTLSRLVACNSEPVGPRGVSPFTPPTDKLFDETKPLAPNQPSPLYFYRAYSHRDQILLRKQSSDASSNSRGRLLKALSGSILDNRIYIRQPARESCLRTGTPVRTALGKNKKNSQNEVNPITEKYGSEERLQ